MEIFDPNNSVQTITEPFPEVKDYLSLDQILPDRAGLSEPVSSGSPSLIPEQVPVLTEIDTGDDLLPGPIQKASPPPSRLQPLTAEPADAIVGNSAVVNQEAIASLGRPGNGVKVEYYDNADFTSKVLTRIDPKIDFNWGDGSPDSAIAPDTFSARWTGKLQPDFTELYTFSIQSDATVRLLLDGEPVIDNAEGGAIALEAGQLHDFIFEYAHASGDAAVELFWSSPSQPQEIIPTSALYTPETRLQPEPESESSPDILQFLTNMFYNPGETVRFRGQVYEGDRDLTLVDFWLQLNGGEWVDISDGTEFVPDRNNPGYAFFNYELSGLEPGQYQLRGSAIADDFTSGTVTQSFTVLDLPSETDLPDNVRHAIARAANLENYSPAELAATRQWVVNLGVGQSSAELATALGARDLGATGYMPNSFIWEFPPDVDPIDVASQLSELLGVQFAYPQVPAKLESLSNFNVPPNDPLFVEQWHLKNIRQTGGKLGLDANVTTAWELATGNGVVIGIVDDGLQHNHPDLRGNYRPDLSRDFNEGDLGARNYDDDPVPFSQGLTFEVNLETPLAIEGDIPPLYVDLDGVVENLKLTLNSDHPAPQELFVYLESPSEIYELIPGDADYEYILDGELPSDESSSGEWKLFIENDSEIPGQLYDWSLALDVWNSHGTAVAGVAAASGNNNLGVTGVAPDAELAGLRLIAAERVNPIQMADALYSELNQEIDIYNNSWKPPVFWSAPEALSALEAGVTAGRDGLGNIYVFGAGNNAGLLENVNYNAFANSRYTIAVGAIDHKGWKSKYSQEGASLLVSAPSSNNNGNNKVGITTTDLVGSQGYKVNGSDLDYTNDFGGTSSATPVVSGVVALMLEVNPDLTWRDVQHILVKTANREKIRALESTWSGEETDEIRHSHQYGFGVVDAEAAVNAAASWTPVPKEVSIGTSSKLDFSREIPDGDNNGVTELIPIESDITVEWVEVVFDADHELRSDLKIELTSPSGTKSLLAFPWIEFPESDAGYDNWVLTSVRHWDESSEGEWQLQVVDTRLNNQTGTWNSWELNFYGTKPAVSLEVTEPDASEDGDVGSFTVTRTGNTDYPLIVNYSESGTATAGEDYEALTETVEIPAGEDSVTVAIVPIDDDEVEGDETVFVVIDADDAYDIGTDSSATVTIADNDFVNNPPTLTGIELLTGATEGTSFTISYRDLMEQSDAVDADGDPISLEISTIASGTLTKNDVPVEPGVTILSEGEAVVWTPDNAGDEVAAFTVRVFDGKDYSEQVQVNVAVAVMHTEDAFSFTSPTQTGTLSWGNELVFSIDPASAAASDVTLDIFALGDINHADEYLSVFGRGTGVADWTFLDYGFYYSTSVNFYEGEVQDTLTIAPDLFNSWIATGNGSIEIKLTPSNRVQNHKDDPDEYAFISLNYQSIDPNDFNNPPTLTGIELLTGAKEETSFTISYSDLMAKSDATDADGDPIALQISTIASGTLMKNDVPVEPGVTTLSEGEAVVWTPDNAGDRVTAFAVRLFDGTDYSEQVQVNVAVAALPVVTISATDANASEDGDSGEFTVTRTGDTTESLEVSYSIAGDATAGTDYSEIANIVIPAGFSEVAVPLDPIDDEEIEGDETVVLNLSAGTGYLLGEENSAQVSIADSDRQNSLADLKIFALSNSTTVAPNGALTYTLFVINSGSQAATDIEISDTLPVDFSLLSVTPQGSFVADISTPGIVSFTGGRLVSGDLAILTISGNVSPDAVGSLINTVVVDPDNQIAESDETNNTATATTTVNAIASLPVVTISATDANASEDGDSGEFTVTRSGGDTTESLEISYSTAGDAVAGTDYSDIGNIVIPAGFSEVKVPLDPIDDEEIEGDETVVLNLEAGTGYLLGEESSAEVSIADNDPSNHAPTMTYISIPTCIASNESLTISYADLLNASDATDVDGDAISFAIEEVGSEGILTFNGQPVIPGETVLSEGSNLIWTPNTAGDSVPAFTVRAIDGQDTSSSVEVTIHVLEIDEDKILSDVFEIRFTDIKAVEYDPEGDKFQFQFEILNWTNQPAEGLRIALNTGTNSYVQDAAPRLVDAQIDGNGSPLGPDAYPLPGNQFFYNTGTVQESTSTAIQWKTSQFDFNTFQNRPIPNQTPVIYNAERIDDCNNVLDGFVFTVDDFDELEALSFNWNLLDENDNSIGTFRSDKSYGFGSVIMTRSESQHSPTFELSNANSSQSDRVQNRFFTKEYRVE